MSLENPVDGAETPAEDQTLDLRDELASAFDGPETAAVEPGTTAPASPATAAPEQNQPSLLAPKHWSQADRDLFSKAPPDIQQRWLDREKEVQKGVDGKAQELAALKREWESIDSAFKPFERDLGLMGMSKNQFLGSLIHTHKWLSEDPVAALQWVAQQYQVDLKQLLSDPDQPAADPAYKALQTELGSVRSTLQGFLTEQQQVAHQANLSKVTAFAEAKDEAGKPLHPYFDEVAQDIVKLMRAGEKDLDAAYKKALRMNDEVFEKVQGEKLAANKANEDKMAAARLAKAKKAAVGTDGQVQGVSAKKSLRQDLEDAFANL
jgi:hypothetical protein